MRPHISSHTFIRLLCAFLGVDGTESAHCAVADVSFASTFGSAERVQVIPAT